MAFDIDGVLRVTRLYYSDKVRNPRGTEDVIMRFGDVSYGIIGSNADEDQVMILGGHAQLADDLNPSGVESNVLTKLEPGPKVSYDPLTDKDPMQPSSDYKQYMGEVHFKHLNV